MTEPPPNFHLSYEKLKKTAEELRGGGDKDAEYWAWRNDGSESDSEEDDFMSWLKAKRSSETNNNKRRGRKAGGKERNSAPPPKKEEVKTRKKKQPITENDTTRPALWEPGEWDSGNSHHHQYAVSKPPKTAKGGGVLKLPRRINSTNPSQPHSPIGVIRNSNCGPEVGCNDFIYSESSDSDGAYNEEYTAAVLAKSSAPSVLNVVGIERKVEKCSVEATQCSSTFCKESCKKFLAEAMRKRGSLDVLFDAFEDHHTEIIHLRQELACTVSCAMMYDLEICQEKQVEGVLWKNTFYLLIQHYRNTISSTKSDNQKSQLAQQLEDHILEGVNFYNMLVRQIQKRYKVNYKHHTTGHNRSQVLALLLLHKLFLWIGDLYRYLSQTRDTEEWGQARNFYLLAQTLAPRNPRPYHQLALLGKYAHRRLHAVFYFTLSLMVRNPFTQSKELLLAVLAELRRKALLLAKRDKERSSFSNPATKEVYSNKVVEWVFENLGDQSLNIPLPDLRKRLVVYLLSSLGGLLSNIDLNRVDPDFTSFHKFYLHYLQLSAFKQDEVYQQLFIVMIYTIHFTRHSHKCIPMLERFLTPALQVNRLVSNNEGDAWLCELHSPLSLILLFSQSQLAGTEVIEAFSDDFKHLLIAWLNALQTSIYKYRKYTDFTEESVILKEITLLRGVEVLSSLQNVTKPFYLSNLSREQSEDLGRAVLVISTFENLSPRLTFLHCSEERVFSWCEKEVVEEPEEEKVEEDEEEEEEAGEEMDEEEFLEKISTRRRGRIEEEEEEEDSDDGPDVEIISSLQISGEANEGRDSEMTELIEKKEKLLQTLQENQDKTEEVRAAVKEIQGVRTQITVKPKHIVPDTNCFLDGLDKLQRVFSSCYKVLVPLVVLDEITGLCKNADKKEEAERGLEAINSHIANKTTALLTSKGSIMDTCRFKEERSRLSNDDLILNGVLALSDSTGTRQEDKDALRITRSVVFLTNDNNLRVKAHSYNLAVQTLADFVKCAKL